MSLDTINKRWLILQRAITIMENSASEIADPTQKTIHCLLDGLRNFVNEQYDYFKTAPVPTDYTTEFALSVILSRAAKDLEAIERIIYQRDLHNNLVDEALNKAEQYTTSALTPAISPFFNNQRVRPLTYLQKASSIRVIPYANVAMIGVPYTCVNVLMKNSSVSRDFLAVPHEVGHYVYWHGQTVYQGVSKLHLFNAVRKSLDQFGELPNWARNWTQEIFADVYGARIAGPLIALDFQELELENRSNADLMHDDADHPLPALRPIIYTKVLERLGEEPWVTTLEQRWSNELSNRNVGDAFLPRGEKKTKKRADAEFQVDKIVEVVYKLLSEINTIEKWSPKDVVPNNCEDLFKKFESGECDPALLQPVHEMPGCATHGFNEMKQALLDESKFAEKEEGEDSGQKETREWLALLRAGGWTTGPGDTDPHGRP
jgi:hypothetical protein